MPLKLYHTIKPEGEIGIWEVREPETYFTERLNFTSGEVKQLAEMKGKRKLEWLAVRYLLHFMSGRDTRGAVLKDEFGKPRLEDSKWNISMSHTMGKVAVIASPLSVGIDIQKFVERIDRIESKFMNTKESACLSELNRREHLHIFWGAKECLYKAYGRKELVLKEHIQIAPFELNNQKGQTTGKIIKGDFDLDFNIFFDKIEEYFLVWAIEKN